MVRDDHPYHVVIFMATYQGAKFLKEQLDSIINQTFLSWELYISDDGSKDETMDILQEYQQKEPRIIRVLNNQGKHGAFANFFSLIQYAKRNIEKCYDYYFYCDQDDIWQIDKIEQEVQCMIKYQEKSENPKPVLCYSDLSLMDGEGKVMGFNLGDISDIKLDNPYNIFFSERYIWGTTMAHDLSLWKLIEIPENIPKILSHDNFIGRYAAVFGEILFLPRATVYYRRHGGNVTAGVPHSYTLWQGISRVFTKLPEVLKNHAVTYWGSLYFINHVHRKTDVLKELEQCLSCGGVKAYYFVKRYNINTSPNFFNRAAFFLILYSGIYKMSRIFNNSFRD